jgi:hypothetical protein
MLRYSSLPPTPHLNLHVCYKQSENPEIWIGYVQEVGGIVLQSASVQELFDDAIEVAGYMLKHYKRAEAFALLRTQGHDLQDVGQEIAFTLSDGPTPPSPF